MLLALLVGLLIVSVLGALFSKDPIAPRRRVATSGLFVCAGAITALAIAVYVWRNLL